MKRLILIVTTTAITLQGFAGGLVTNTNRSTAFLRNIARGTTFAPDAVYFNPAGTAFMENGWHIDLSIQQAIQSRTTEATFAPLGQNASYLGETTRNYIGNTYAPFVPSLNAVWKKNRWAVMASFSIGAGGGGIDYKKGVSTFETDLYSLLPGILSASGLPTTMYSAESSLSATSFTGMVSVGGAFQILPCLAVSLQANLSSSYASYDGHLTGISVNPTHPLLNPTGAMINAADLFNALGMTEYAELVSDKKLESSQQGFGIAPVIALCFNHKGWTANVKYEFMTSMYLKNSTKHDIVINGIGMFPDGGKDSNDLPAELTIAGGYDFGKVRVCAEWSHYFDKAASNDYSSIVLGNTNEYKAGVEWNVSKAVLLSCGAQRSVYNLNVEEFTDMAFGVNATSFGIGGGVQICKLLRLEGGLMYTLYDSRTRTEEIYHDNPLNLPGSDTYKRTNLTFGIGAIFRF